MWSQSGAKQAPDTFHSVDMDLVDTVSIGIPGILPFTVIDRDMDVAPSWETGIDAVLIGVDGAALLDHLGDPGSKGGLLDVTAQVEETLSTARNYPQDRGLSVAAVPRPRLPFRRLHRPTRPSLGQSSVLDQNSAPGHAWSPVDHA